MQLIITLFDIIWLSAVLALLWLIWRTNIRHTRRLEQTLIDATMKAASAAQKSADAVYALVESRKA